MLASSRVGASILRHEMSIRQCQDCGVGVRKGRCIATQPAPSNVRFFSRELLYAGDLEFGNG